jgi:hypothetical protein
MPVGMERARPGVPLAQPHPLFRSFPLIFDSSYYKQILSNLMKTFEIVRFGAKRGEIPKHPPPLRRAIFGSYLVIFW